MADLVENVPLTRHVMPWTCKLGERPEFGLHCNDLEHCVVCLAAISRALAEDFGYELGEALSVSAVVYRGIVGAEWISGERAHELRRMTCVVCARMSGVPDGAWRLNAPGEGLVEQEAPERKMTLRRLLTFAAWVMAVLLLIACGVLAHG